MRRPSPQLVLAVAVAASGCNIIKPDLLEGSDASRSDAKEFSDAAVDAPLDAYEPLQGNLVVNPGLENGTSTGWATNGGSAQIAINTSVVHQGTASLLTTGRSGAWNGPATSLFGKIRHGRTYTATVWARLTAPATDKFFISIRHTCVETGATERFNVDNNRTHAIASDTTWVQPTSTWTAAAPPACTLSSFIVYVETENTTLTTFYVDDLDVREQP